MTLPMFSDDTTQNQPLRIFLAPSLLIEVVQDKGKSPSTAKLYLMGVLIKEVVLSDKTAKRLFIVEAVDLGACKSQLANILGVSRQTIDNNLKIRNRFGAEGLVHGYNIRESNDRRRQRNIHKEDLTSGNKARLIEQIEAAERSENRIDDNQISFAFEHTVNEVLLQDQPFAENHDWIATRYAGKFIYLIVLISQWSWLRLVMGCYGPTYQILMVFVLLASGNIPSIEQLKNVIKREAGVVLGIKTIECAPNLRKRFYAAVRLRNSTAILATYFKLQVTRNLVKVDGWFIDGHLLPYTGSHMLHSSFSTQRQIPVPGRTSMVVCDSDGMIVDYEIQEAKGNLRKYIIDLGQKWKKYIPLFPLLVCDREGHGADFYIGLVNDKTPFVTWEKNIDSEKLNAVDDNKFSIQFELNDKSYAIFEDEKIITDNAKEPKKAQSVILRRINIWNRSCNRRISVLAWTNNQPISTEDCARAMLNRWGASENTFKHIKTRQPFHYNPGLKFEESDSQDVANPEIKNKKLTIERTKRSLFNLYKKLSKTKETLTSTGKARRNSKREQLQKSIAADEAKLNDLNEEKKNLKDRVDISTTGHKRSFKKIINEGKYLFDFASISVWNARKLMVDWLGTFYNEQDDVVDLFYTITNCHGWIRSTETEITVRLEPLQQPKRRLAQEKLCQKLTNLAARTTNYKRMIVEVGEVPLKKLS